MVFTLSLLTYVKLCKRGMMSVMSDCDSFVISGMILSFEGYFCSESLRCDNLREVGFESNSAFGLERVFFVGNVSMGFQILQ